MEDNIWSDQFFTDHPIPYTIDDKDLTPNDHPFEPLIIVDEQCEQSDQPPFVNRFPCSEVSMEQEELRNLVKTESEEMVQLSTLMSSIYLELVDELSLEVCFDVHKQYKVGSHCLDCDATMPSNQPGTDIFGQTASDIGVLDSFECLNCGRAVSATRYAPHLEKCMGMGRTSSRIASKRLANTKEGFSYPERRYLEVEEDEFEWEIDDDWAPLDTKTKPKKLKSKTAQTKS
eukprot:TRINITY_DN7597_c2_g1_i1.p1 TRINITY_DN7597_c2_g1~~TRINITY_DN7597_c2_g1_i1.p1  ORF type:complete len:231 (+),score=60.52 TRINITY_DN7597_c2_g1_i1:41-733(+)